MSEEKSGIEVEIGRGRNSQKTVMKNKKEETGTKQYLPDEYTKTPRKLVSQYSCRSLGTGRGSAGGSSQISAESPSDLAAAVHQP